MNMMDLPDSDPVNHVKSESKGPSWNSEGNGFVEDSLKLARNSDSLKDWTTICFLT